MKRRRKTSITRSEIPKGTLADSQADDAVRRVVSPRNIRFINGTMLLTGEGVSELVNAVTAGRIQGDPAKAARLLAFLNSKYPQP